jgi:5-deoxy-glucuronate isomerase
MDPARFLFRGPRAGFPANFTRITDAALTGDTSGMETGIEFGIRLQPPHTTLEEVSPLETAWVLLRGTAVLEFPGQRVSVQRGNIFDDPPTALHVPHETPLAIRTGDGEAEWAVVRTVNGRNFAPHLYLPSQLKPEYRGAGLVQNACLRNVRLIFDLGSRPEANLVLGEVVNYPGRWSSYPPHHHDQPEIYHYRFTAPAGYGHAELGDDVVKVRHGDTVVIPPGRDHAQVSAPGYGMYYLWMIRHLPGNPYAGFTFAEPHRWVLDPAQQGWKPTGLPQGLA